MAAVNYRRLERGQAGPWCRWREACEAGSPRKVRRHRLTATLDSRPLLGGEASLDSEAIHPRLKLLLKSQRITQLDHSHPHRGTDTARAYRLAHTLRLLQAVGDDVAQVRAATVPVADTALTAFPRTSALTPRLGGLGYPWGLLV